MITNYFESFRESLAATIAPSLVEKRDNALRLANTDALTGLGSPLALELASPTALQDGLAFIVFDANNFGKVNKVVSYATGSELLKTFALTLGKVATMYKARAFRMGGDEFVIIAPAKFASAIRDAVERRVSPVEFPGFEVSISGEVGSSIADADSRLQARKAVRKA